MEMTTRILADSAFGCAGQRCLAASVAITVRRRPPGLDGADGGSRPQTQGGLRMEWRRGDGPRDLGREQDSHRRPDRQDRSRKVRECWWTAAARR